MSLTFEQSTSNPLRHTMLTLAYHAHTKVLCPDHPSSNFRILLHRPADSFGKVVDKLVIESNQVALGASEELGRKVEVATNQVIILLEVLLGQEYR